MRAIKISEPDITRVDITSIVKVLQSANLAQGKKVAEFEKNFANYIGSKYAIATSNGTTSLHLALLTLNLQPNDEVITTPFSFIASTNAILYVNAKPVFVDIGPDYNLDSDKIEEKITKNTKAILVVHLYGYPANMKKILKIARKYSLKVIEDCAQAHGAKIDNKTVGTFGDLGCFSFYPTKNMTTVEGGMVTTNNLRLAEKIKLLRNHGSKKRYHHQILGYNFRMNEVQAALGSSQLKRIDANNEKRSQNATTYRKYLQAVPNITLPPLNPDFKSVYHQFTIRTKKRGELKNKLANEGIQTEIYYPSLITQQPFIKKLVSKTNLPMAEKICKEVLSLPIHPQVTKSEIKYICEKIKEIVLNN